MERRTFMRMSPSLVPVLSLATVLVVGIVASSVPAEAQPAGKVARLGWLASSSVVPTAADLQKRNAFLNQLRDLGWVEGQNLIIERRFTEGHMERQAGLANELTQLKVDAIFTAGDRAIQDVKDATNSIPIVMIACDALATGLIASLARPGGNVTGVTCITADLSAKRADLLRQATPALRRLAILYNPADPHTILEVKHTRATAEAWKIPLLPLEFHDPDQLESLFALMKKERTDALLTVGDNLTLFHRAAIVQLAAKNRLPTMYGFRDFTDAGGLISYGPNLPEMFRQAAFYVDKILKGAKPADLPVEQPTKFELVINLKAARELGLTIPPSLLARADQVIE
jgi:putative ABC transport system substrate-binding protein